MDTGQRVQELIHTALCWSRPWALQKQMPFECGTVYWGPYPPRKGHFGKHVPNSYKLSQRMVIPTNVTAYVVCLRCFRLATLTSLPWKIRLPHNAAFSQITLDSLVTLSEHLQFRSVSTEVTENFRRPFKRVHFGDHSEPQRKLAIYLQCNRKQAATVIGCTVAAQTKSSYSPGGTNMNPI